MAGLVAPAGQGVQVRAPVEEKVAGGQRVGVVVPPRGQAEPGGHKVGIEAPPEQNEPAGQGAQELAPELLKVPGRQEERTYSQIWPKALTVPVQLVESLTQLSKGDISA